MTTEELLKTAAEPTLIASTQEAHRILGELNAIIAHLRGEVRDLELASDLELNRILKTDIAIERGKAEWKTGEIYREWQTKKGILSDVRAVRKTMDRHAELLSSQERFPIRKTPTYREY